MPMAKRSTGIARSSLRYAYERVPPLWQWQASQDINGRAHVGLDFSDTQCPVVEPHLVQAAPKIISPDTIGAKAQGTGGGGDAPSKELAGDWHAIDVEAQHGAVIGAGQVTPDIEGQRGAARAGDAVLTARGGPCIHEEPRAFAGRAGVEDIDEIAGLLLHEDGARARGPRWIDPGLQRHTRREVEGGGVVDRDPVVTAIEGQCPAKLAGRRPGCAVEGAIIASARHVVERGAGAFIAAIGRDQSGGIGLHGDRVDFGGGVRAPWTADREADGIGARRAVQMLRAARGAGDAIAKAPAPRVNA